MLANNKIINFKAVQPLTSENLRDQAPSIYATAPMLGLSSRYTFVPTTEIVSGLMAKDWVPICAEQQRVRSSSRFGFQKHLIRFRRSSEIETLEEWNTELVLTNSHDAGCAYVLRVGLFRRVCSNGLVISDQEFQALRFRHAGLRAEDVIEGSLRLLEYVSRVGVLIERLRSRMLNESEARRFASQALSLRFDRIDLAPVSPNSLLQARRPEDESNDSWTVLNRVQENLVRGGISDGRRDGARRIRSLRALKGIDSRITINLGLWELARQLLDGRN